MVILFFFAGGGGGGFIGFFFFGGGGCGLEVILDIIELGVLEFCRCGNIIGLIWVVVNIENEEKKIMFLLYKMCFML